MFETEKLDTVVEACIAAHVAVMEHGSSAMKLASRVLLMTLAQAIAASEAGNDRLDDAGLRIAELL